jgi:hypothetical protein
MFGFDGRGCDFMTAAYEGTVEIVASIGKAMFPPYLIVFQEMVGHRRGLSSL